MGARAVTEPLRIGIVGAGAVVQVAHLPVLKKLKNVEVRALCDNDLPKARALADRFGIKDAFDDIEELLRYEELDAVVVSSPTHLHEAHVAAALAARLHVLVEKPLTISAASAQRIVRAAEKSDRIVMVGMNHRYRPDVQIVRGFIQTGELGKIESARGSWHVHRPSRTQLGWRQRRDQSGGGAMIDLGLTILDLGLWLAGGPAPTRVSASARRAGQRARGRGRRGSAFVVCEEGMSVFLDVTWRAHRRGRAVRRGNPGHQGHRRGEPPQGVEGVSWRADRRFSNRVRRSGDGVQRVLPRAVGALSGGDRRGGEGRVARGAREPASRDRRYLPVGAGRTRRHSLTRGPCGARVEFGPPGSRRC